MRRRTIYKALLLAALGWVLFVTGRALAERWVTDASLASPGTKMVAGLALTLVGLTVMASMFIVRKWLWRYLGVHANDRMRRFGSIGLTLAVLGVAGAAWSGEPTPIAEQVPGPWLWVAMDALAVLLGAIALRALADVVLGRDSKWGGWIRYGGSGAAVLGIAGVLLIQVWILFHLDEKLAALNRLKDIHPIQRIVQIFKR
jgi:hypothetical protein